MKKFLLTWYGITDFRASLGFENTDGIFPDHGVGFVNNFFHDNLF